MNKKVTIGAVLFVIGLVIMAIGVQDIASIISSVLNIVFKLELPDVLFNSFIFRNAAILIGGLITIIGAIIVRKNNTDI